VVIYNECPARKENYDFTVFWYNLDLADSIYCYQTNSVEGTAASFFKALNNIYTFNSPFPGLLRVHWYQKDSEWQWHQLGHTKVCTSLQTDNHANTPPLSFYRAEQSGFN